MRGKNKKPVKSTIDFIRKNALILWSREMAEELKLSVKTIRHYASRNHISLLQNKGSRVDEVKNYVILNHGKISQIQMAEELNVNRSTVIKTYRLLGLSIGKGMPGRKRLNNKNRRQDAGKFVDIKTGTKSVLKSITTKNIDLSSAFD